MARFKKILFTALSGISGLLLTLAGLNLIELSPKLVLYTGVLLLVLSILFYLLPETGKKEVSSKLQS